MTRLLDPRPSPHPIIGATFRVRDREHQDFLGSQFVNHEIRESLRDRATNRHVIRDRFEMRMTGWIFFDPQQCRVKHLQEPTAESGLPTFISASRGVGFSFRNFQESNGKTHDADISFSFKSASIS